MESTKVSFVCTIYNHPIKLIERMLLSLATVIQYCPYFEFDIIIVVNDNLERDFEQLDGIFSSRVNISILNSERNTGYCGGNNIGIEHSNNDYIVIVNPDIIFKESLALDWLIGTAKLYNTISGKVVGNSAWYTYAATFPTDKKHAPDKLPFYFNEPTLDKPGNWKKFPYVDGALMCFPKTLWKEIGGFDESIFPGYFGENAFVFSAYLNGHIYYDAHIEKYYEHKQDHDSNYSQNIINWSKLGRAYFYEHYALPNWDKFLEYLRD